MKYINKQTTNFKDNDQQDQRHLDSKNQMNQPFGFQQLPIVNNFANTKKNEQKNNNNNNGKKQSWYLMHVIIYILLW